MKLDVEKWYISLEISDWDLGIGWWRVGNKIAWKWFQFNELYYDGYWFVMRIGPFYISRGPYWPAMFGDQFKRK